MSFSVLSIPALVLPLVGLVSGVRVDGWVDWGFLMTTKFCGGGWWVRLVDFIPVLTVLLLGVWLVGWIFSADNQVIWWWLEGLANIESKFKVLNLTSFTQVYLAYYRMVSGL